MEGIRQIALVISDIDGTLVTSNHEVTPATKRAAHALLAAGIRLALASSRPPRAIKPIADALGLKRPTLPLMVDLFWQAMEAELPRVQSMLL